MKKKILSLGVIAVLIVMLISLTGCGEKESSNNQNNVVTNESEVSNQISKEEMQKLEVEKVYATSENYAVVRGKDLKIYIIDKEGIVQGTVNDAISTTVFMINKNGYVSQVSNNNSKVLDKTGKVIFESSGTEYYKYGITPDGYLLKRTTESDFETGSSEKWSVIDINGNIVHELSGEVVQNHMRAYSINYLGGNIFSIGGFISGMGNLEQYLLNAKTGEIKKAEVEIGISDFSTREDKDYVKHSIELDNGMIVVNESVLIKEDLTCVEFNNKIAINEKYYYDEDAKTICNYDGPVAKEITEGDGITNIYYADDKYYVSSGTKYYYVMDNNFEQIKEPIKLGKSVNAINKYGVIVNKDVTTRQSALYDFEGNLLYDFNNYYAYDPQDFVARTFIDSVSNDTMPVNLNTGEVLTIYK